MISVSSYPGNSKEEADRDHDKNVASLLEKCSKQDLRLSVKTLQFKSPSVTFIDHKLTNKGVEPDPAKTDAITNMPTPTDKSGVQRFLGICQYLSKFCQNVSETVLTLRDLTKENSTFLWSKTMKTHSTQPTISLHQRLRYATTILPFP